MLRHSSDECVYVPMRGMGQSLNVSVTCGILLQHLATHVPALPLPEDERMVLQASWLMSSVKNAHAILKRRDVDISDFI